MDGYSTVRLGLMVDDRVRAVFAAMDWILARIRCCPGWGSWPFPILGRHGLAMSAIYKHNCAQCIYLGTSGKVEDKPTDLYVHHHRSGRITIKARHGHEPNEYASWGGAMPPPKDCHPALHKAYAAAVALDLIPRIKERDDA